MVSRATSSSPTESGSPSTPPFRFPCDEGTREAHDDDRSINELSNVNLQFPIIADPTREIAKLYDMLDEQDLTNLDTKGIPFTVRSGAFPPPSLVPSSSLTSSPTVYVIDPKKAIRLVLTYPVRLFPLSKFENPATDGTESRRLPPDVSSTRSSALSTPSSSETPTRSPPPSTGSLEERSSFTPRFRPRTRRRCSRTASRSPSLT